ncbi:MAG: hypothetical protein NTU51_00055 [Bacteroidetes bacterium]|nr:hypothetical protein [Bacteroidota bacterium]
MKKYLFLIAVLFASSFAWAQSNKEEIDLMQAAFGKDKKAVVAEFVKVSPAQKDAFWKLYDEYETQRKALGKERIDLLKQYADHYFDFTPVQADEWTKKVIALGKKTDDLIISYYGKVKAVSDGIIATQFYQIENYILVNIRVQILQKVPFIQKPAK